MKTLARPARVPAWLFEACGYFFPRLLFLQSRRAPQTHWGDIALALHDFPEQCNDIRSEAFWDAWMIRWEALGERYASQARASDSNAGQARAYRGAAACFHWAEFMYFSDARKKTALRSRVRECFRRSLSAEGLPHSEGSIVVEGERVSYMLFLPETASEQPAPCVIFSNGLDSMTEVEVYAFAEQYLDRGVAALLFEGPGQGLDVGRRPLRIHMEDVVQALVEHLRGLPHIDAGRLGFFGVSFGGYFALRTAQRLGRLFACVVNLSSGPWLAPYETLPRRLKDDFRFAFMGGDARDMQTRFDALELDPAEACGTEVLSVHGGSDDIFPLAGLRAIDEAWGARHHLMLFESEAHVCLNTVNHYGTDAADWAARRLLAATLR